MVAMEPRGAMCHVVMDEAGVGKDAAGLRRSDETLMHRGHDLWLATLKWVAEAKGGSNGSWGLLRVFLAWIIGRIDVGNRERALHVHLNRRASGGVRIVMHVRYCNA